MKTYKEAIAHILSATILDRVFMQLDFGSQGTKFIYTGYLEGLAFIYDKTPAEVTHDLETFILKGEIDE